MTSIYKTGRRKSRVANAIFFFISGFGYAAWASRIPTIKQELQLSDSVLGMLLFAMPIGLICTLPLTNYLLRRYSSNKLMLFGSIGFSIALALAGLASAVWQLAILLWCFGSMRNLLNISMNAQAVSIQKLYKKKSVITAFHGIWSIAGFSGAAIGYLTVMSGVPTHWHFIAVGLALTITSVLQYRSTLEEIPEPRRSGRLFSLPNKQMLNYAFIVFICMACENTMYDWSGVYFQKTMDAPPALATSAFAAYMAMMAIGRFTGDRIVNKIGVRQMLQYSAVTLATGFSIAILFPYPVTGFIGFMMAGFGVSCISPLVFSLAGKSTKQGGASVLASISSISYIGFLIVPPVIGLVSEAMGIRFSFGLIAVMAFLMLYFINRIQQDSHKMTEHPEEAIV